VTFQKIHTQEIEAKDIDAAARVACAIVLGQPKDSVKVLSILPGADARLGYNPPGAA
jgi:hypothetical protein